MASLLSAIESAALGPAITSRSGTKISSITTSNGNPVFFLTPQPLVVPFFSSTGYSGESDRINLCLTLDQDTYQILKVAEDALKALAVKTLGLDERDFTPMIKESDRYSTRLLRCKIQRTGPYSTLFWNTGPEAARTPIEMPEDLSQTLVQARIQVSGIWQQGRNFGISLRATDVQCHGEVGAQTHECPF